MDYTSGDSEEKTNTDRSTMGKCLLKYGCYGISIILLVILPLSMITIGSIYFYECPFQRYIPVFLVVAGSMTVLSGITTIVIDKVDGTAEEENTNRSKVYQAFTYLIYFITLSWYIAGFVWVYGARPLPANQNCHQVIYSFSQWLCNSLLSMFILWVIVYPCYRFYESKGGSQYPPLTRDNGRKRRSSQRTHVFWLLPL